MHRRLRPFTALTAALLLAAGGPAWPAEPGDALQGLWRGQMVFPSPHGELTIIRKGADWRAQLGAAETPFTAKGGEIRFELPGGGGFRGRLADHGRAIRGFWLKPAASLPHGGAGQAFASPMTLRAAGAGRWQGATPALTDSFTLYARIYRDADGRLVGALRNPEANFNGGASLFDVSRDGDAVRFSIKPGPSAQEIEVKAAYAAQPERLRVELRGIGPVELSRPTPEQARDFYPRPPGTTPYVYHRPAETGDGWATARARDVGMDEARLQALVRRLAGIDPSMKRPPLIHSVLVAHRGKLVLEEYFFGYGRDTVHDTRSAGKTFASVMLGAEMMAGVKLSPDSRIYQVMAPLGPFANPDPRKDQMTLAHLMTHSAGLACDDNDEASPGNEETMQTQSAQPHWWKYTLDLPMAHDPGTRYAYCSANINLVGGALSVAGHAWLPELFDETVARPLQFGPYFWDLAADGEGYQGGGAFIRPRDLLKLGQAYLDGGVWRGRRIVPADWVRTSTLPRIDINPATTGLSPEDFGNFYGEGRDGFTWHLSSFEADGRRHDDYAATGNGGQLLIVVPDYDLTVVFTAGNYGQGGIWSRFRSEIVPKEIVSAIVRAD